MPNRSAWVYCGVADDLAVAVLPEALPHRPARRDDRVEPAAARCSASAARHRSDRARCRTRPGPATCRWRRACPSARSRPDAAVHGLLGDPLAALRHRLALRRRLGSRAPRRSRGPRRCRSCASRGRGRRVAETGRLLQVLGAGPLLPPGLRREHRALRVERQPLEVAPVAVDPGLDPDLRRVVLRGDLDAQRADPAVGHARAAQRLQAGPAAVGVLEDGGPRQEPVPQVQRAVVVDDPAGVDVEADPVDEHGGVEPVRGVDQVDHRDVVAVVDAGQERARQLAEVALLQASAGAEPAVADVNSVS